MSETVKNSTSKPLLAQLRDMEVGEVLILPIERKRSVRCMCSDFGYEWNKTFTTSTDREKRIITVTRKS